MSVAIDYTGGAFAANKAQGVGTITGSAIDVSSGNYFAYTPTANTTFTFSNAPASGTATGFALAVTGANVSSGYDLANASYDSVSFSVATQDSTPRGIFMKPDGSVLYMAGLINDRVYQYSLSTAWDLSSAAYVQNISVSSQETSPASVFFKPDGTSMFIVGFAGDEVNQYSLSTAWDISTATYSQNFSVASQSGTPMGLFFKEDGLRMYISNYTEKNISEYTLSTAWDISTASYSQNFSVASPDVSPIAIFFKPDGSEMFVVGELNDAVYLYSLSTAWDISTASYASINFSAATQETAPNSIFFKSDGTKMYVGGAATDTIYQYSTGSSAPATVSYPSSVDWAGGTAPDAPAAGEKDVLVFYTDDGGTNWYGFQAGDAMA